MAGKKAKRRMWFRAVLLLWTVTLLSVFSFFDDWKRRQTTTTDVGIGKVTSSGIQIDSLRGIVLKTSSDITYWFECRVLGPGGCILVCDVDKISPHTYLISSSPVPYTGTYVISLTISHVGVGGADPVPPIRKQFEAIELPNTHPIFVKATTTKCIPHWKSKEEYIDCMPNGNTTLPDALTGPLILMGDSHMRGWRDVLTASEGFQGPYQRLDGLLSPGGAGQIAYIRAESLQITAKINSTVIPKHLQFGFDHTFHQIEQLQNLILLLKEESSRKIVVAANFGSWDLRDVAVEEYCKNLVVFEKKVASMDLYNLKGVKWVWRSTPSYTYRGNNYRTTDVRTNEKIRRANECARQTLTKWHHHDTFAITHPVFLDSCDTHHYLCPPSSDKAPHCPLVSSSHKVIGVGCAGKADLLTFLKLAFG